MRNTTIRLAAPAVKAILDADPEMKFELQRCVVAEVVRHMMPNDLDEVYRKVIADEVNKSRQKLLTDIGREGKTYDKLVEKQIGDAVDKIRQSYYTDQITGEKKERLSQAIGKAIEVGVSKEIEAKVSSIQDAIGGRIDRLVEAKKLDAKIEQAIDAQVEAEIERRVAERIAKLAEAARTMVTS